jgi:hypothetical protein
MADPIDPWAKDCERRQDLRNPCPEENLAELQAQATTFAQKQLPILKALQIA